MPKGAASKRYTPEFKDQVIKVIPEEGLSYCEACRRFKVKSRERICLEERLEGLRVEHRGRGSASLPKTLPKETEDLSAEVQRLRAENDHLKNLKDLVLEDERRRRRKRR